MNQDTEDTRWEMFEATQQSSGNGQPASPSPTNQEETAETPATPESTEADDRTHETKMESSTKEDTKPTTGPTEATVHTKAIADVPEVAVNATSLGDASNATTEADQATLAETLQTSTIEPTNPTETQASPKTPEKPISKGKSKPQELGPLPTTMQSAMLTEEEVAERTRKNLYPIPFPIFSCLWPAEDMVFVGGGGGRPGTGISSGLVVCRTGRTGLQCCADVDSQDYLVFQMALHPARKEFIGAVGGRVYRFSFDG